MALDVAGLHAEAERAYEWLVDIQRPDGSWWNYYLPDGSVEEAKLDTNVCAYIATGVWHHWLCTWDRGFVDHLWPTVERAIDWVLGMRKPDGTVLWARTEDDRPWDYALLTGSSSIAHSLRCAAQPGDADQRAATAVVGRRRSCSRDVVANRPEAFEPKERWAMDWYYPVLTGAMTGEQAKARLADELGRVRDGGQGHPLRQRRAVDHRAARPPSARHRLRGHRRPRRPPPICCAWTRSHRLRRRRVLDRHRVPVGRALPLRRDLGLHRAPPSSWPPTRSPAPPPPAASSPPAPSTESSHGRAPDTAPEPGTSHGPPARHLASASGLGTRPPRTQSV